MNTFEFNKYSSPIVNPWAENDFFCQQDDTSSVLSFLKDQDDFLEEKDQDLSFGLDWLVESDRKNFVKESAFFSEDEDLFAKKDRSKSLHLTVNALENLVRAPLAPKSIDVDSNSVQLKKTIKKVSKKSYSKALSVKSTKAKISKKAKLVKKATRSNKKSKSLKAKNWKIDTLDNCSTLSNSRKSTHSQSTNVKSPYSGFSDIQELSEMIKADVESTFKLNQKGHACSIPQIFNSNLFSKESKPQQESTRVFMAASMLRNNNSTAKQQIGALNNLLGSMTTKKDAVNFEAGSYMATLESTIRSINKMKDLI
jgi:hypothetical protein